MSDDEAKLKISEKLAILHREGFDWYWPRKVYVNQKHQKILTLMWVENATVEELINACTWTISTDEPIDPKTRLEIILEVQP